MQLIDQLEKLRAFQSEIIISWDRHEGLFPSFRKNQLLHLRRWDDNIFFSASIAYILNRSMPFLDSAEQELARTIISNVVINYSYYENTKGDESYNFWKTKLGVHFPNGKLLHRFKHFRIPDDIDTSSMIYLSQGVSSFKMKERLASHANLASLKVQNSLKKFENLRAYSTWFGVKMPIEFDVCVLSNAMLYVLHNNCPLSTNDEETLKLLRSVIRDSDYFSHLFTVSPEYPKIEVVLYHLSRVVSDFPEHFGGGVIEQLKVDVMSAYYKVSDSISQMVIAISAKRLGMEVDFDLNSINEKQLIDYWWFTAGFLSVFGNWFCKLLAPISIFHYRYFCEAFNHALLFEYKLLCRKKNVDNQFSI